MALEGDLQTAGLPRALHALSVLRQNGILTVQGEEDIVAVSVLEGGIVAADSLNQTTEEALGEMLAERGLVSPDDFAAIAQEHQESGAGSLGDLLVNRGLLDRSELLEALRLQTHRLMVQLLTWQNGEFKFYGGDEISYEDGFRPIAVEELLMRSIDELGNRGRLKGPIPGVDGSYRPVPPRTPVKQIGRDGDGMAGGVWISPRQAQLLGRLEGKTAAAAAQELGLDHHQTLFDLYTLLQNDLIEHLAAAPAPRARSAPELAPQKHSTGPLPQSQPIAVSTGGPGSGEVFVPPDPESFDPDLDAPGPATVPVGALLQKLAGPLLAAVLLFAVTLSLFDRPGNVLLPFPWQENQRETIERQLRYSLFLKIDRAARAYFLIQAHYPDSLQELVDLGLLSPADLRDPAGYQLSYTSADLRYRIDLLDKKGNVVEGLGTGESANGDFLLDPRILRTGGTQEVPLVLLGE